MEDVWIQIDRGTSVYVFKTDEMRKLQQSQEIISIDSSIQGQCRSDLNKIKNQQIKL